MLAKCYLAAYLQRFITMIWLEIHKKITNDVNPKVTPRISGIVLVIPKLNPEYEATTLFGPGV